MTTNGQGWTLIARFSNNDNGHWMEEDGKWWYGERNNNKEPTHSWKKIENKGEQTDPLKNEDMLSKTFWLVRGNEFKITRSDDSQHTALLQTTGGCLGGQTFRSKIKSYGTFKNGNGWASNKCLGNCTVQYGGKYQETEGFTQANCSDNTFQSANNIGFWCCSEDTGAVMMIGGGGARCSGADHGIGVTKANSFRKNANEENDFGDNAISVNKSYSLNLWVH